MKSTYDAQTLWRLPAALSLFALGVLPLAPLISRYERGTFLRDGLAHLLALGVCGALLGLGLGVWIGLRTRRFPAAMAAIFSIAVAVLWWREVFVPLLQGAIP